MNDDILLDAAYIKLKRNEPLSYYDMERIINLVINASWQISLPTPDEAAALKARLISTIKGRFNPD